MHIACQPDSKSIAELIVVCCHVMSTCIRVTGDESLTMLKQVKPTIVTYVGTREKALGAV